MVTYELTRSYKRYIEKTSSIRKKDALVIFALDNGKVLTTLLKIRHSAEDSFGDKSLEDKNSSNGEAQLDEIGDLEGTETGEILINGDLMHDKNEVVISSPEQSV
jgi:hypothetical protein